MGPGRLENRLLAALPRDTVARWGRHMRAVDLTHGKILHFADQMITDVYFPLDCMISVTITTYEGRTAEAGAVGSREMVGINAFMGGRESTHTEYVAQIAGTAIIMPAGPLLDEFDKVKAVRDVLLRYTQAYIAHLSQNVACNRLHHIERRLARWLMECRDRLRSDDLAITHEFLAQILGVRRAGVSETSAGLEARGLIRTGRRRVRILDAQRLEAASCECYRVLRDEYDRLLGPMHPGGAGSTS
jgi:CRP-like cAMP-binding protein